MTNRTHQESITSEVLESIVLKQTQIIDSAKNAARMKNDEPSEMLCQSIERIVKENEELKKRHAEYNRMFDDIRLRITLFPR